MTDHSIIRDEDSDTEYAREEHDLHADGFRYIPGRFGGWVRVRDDELPERNCYE